MGSRSALRIEFPNHLIVISVYQRVFYVKTAVHHLIPYVKHTEIQFDPNLDGGETLILMEALRPCFFWVDFGRFLWDVCGIFALHFFLDYRVLTFFFTFKGL